MPRWSNMEQLMGAISSCGTPLVVHGQGHPGYWLHPIGGRVSQEPHEGGGSANPGGKVSSLVHPSHLEFTVPVHLLTLAKTSLAVCTPVT